jgi:hypothetical protein
VDKEKLIKFSGYAGLGIAGTNLHSFCILWVGKN